MRLKMVCTVPDRPSSRVNRSRLQSTESPSRFIWPRIAPPYSFFQSQTFSMNRSRPKSCLVLPSTASRRSTRVWVAMPAWSIPGSQSTSSPDIRCQRARMSIRVWSRACPTCRLPVTFGGGSTIENGFFAPLSTFCSSARK